jgi:C-terminal processing protease CtpA/Prc
MKKSAFFTILCLFVSYSFSQTVTKNNNFNFGFETVSKPNALPDGWNRYGNLYYEVKIDTLEKHGGNNSILIQSTEKSGTSAFSLCSTSFPAKYEGEQIELKAFMKLQDVTTRPISLLLRIDGEDGILQLYNMQEKDIKGTKDWTLYSVKLPLPDAAKIIAIGAILYGKGKLWVDDFQVLIDGVDISKAKSKKPLEYKADKDKEFDEGSKILNLDLSPEKIEGLAILGKIWGFLKYYHPAIATGDYNWDYELFRILPRVIGSKNKQERNDILSKWISSLGEVECEITNLVDSTLVKIKPDIDWIGNNSILGNELSKQLINVLDAKRKNKHYYINFRPGAGNPQFKNERPDSQMTYPDAGFRLLSLFRYWNIIQYFFPYKNLIEEDWKDVLTEFVPKFLNVKNELDYRLVSLELIARVHDTHANIWGKDEILEKYKGDYYAPLEVTFIEDKAVVTDYFNKELGEKSGVKKGDIIVRINNRNIDDIIKEKLPLTPASNYPTKLRDIARNLLRSKDTSLSIGYKRSNSEYFTKIECFPDGIIDIYQKFANKDTCFKMLDSNIAYLYPGSIKNAYLPKLMPDILKSKGLIIDLRCYPSEFIVFSLSEYFMPDPRSFVTFTNGNIKSPGLFTFGKEIKVGKQNTEYYKGKIVIIINETTQSQAEYTAMAFRVAPKATVIGSTTAGADGNVSFFSLPGGIRTGISGIGVYYPDGRETQRVGIIPDLEIKPTIKGILENRDELLEKAIQIINGK